ncbi:MAG TPA: RICIN domain-containing protein [Bryobacteraceae bacterium]|nr:RICIN domain-containing protein [Bryobacteraceae bacterium]
MRKSTVSLFFLSVCLANAQQQFVTGQAARAELGQPENFSSGQAGSAQNLLGGASGLAYAKGELWVADSNRIAALPENNRVMGFSTTQIPAPYVDLTTLTPFSTACGLCGYEANVVVGQPDFLSSSPGRSQVATATSGSTAEAGSMTTPTAVATDGTYLAVADTDNNRVLIWNPVPTGTNAAPNIVLGQTNFTSFQTPQPVNANSLRGPQGVWIQNGALFVADTQNYRILVWKHIPTQNNQPADIVLGQSSFSSVFQPPITNNFPSTTAQLLLNPTSVTSDGTRLFVADFGNNRVLIWNTAFVNGQLNLNNDQAADVVVGQPNMQTAVPNWSSALCGAADNSAPCAASLNFPRYALSDGKRLFIADGGNDRVLIFNTIPTQNSANADEVLGQVDFVSDQDTSATISITSTLVDNTGAVDVTSSPTSLAFDGTNLYVSDPFNMRVLVFTPADTPLPDKSAVNWASEIIRQEGTVVIGLTSGDSITAGDTVTITVQGTAYTYTVVKNDTLDTIAQGLVTAINSSNSGAGDPNVTAIFAGIGTGTVYVSSKATNLAFDSITLAASVSGTAVETATASGAYLAAGNAGTGSAGMLVEIDSSGSNLSDNTVTASQGNGAVLPTSLGGVEVFMDGIAAPLLSVSPTQIISQIPFSFVNGSDVYAGTAGTEAFTDRNSTSIYVRTVHNDGSVTVSNATPMYIAPANPGLFDAPAYAGQTRPYPAINAYHQPGNATSVVSIDGTVTAGNTATITIGPATYTYTVLSTDTTLTIATNLLNMINSAPDPNVIASQGGSFSRIVLTARLPGLPGTGISITGTSSAGATVTVTAYTPTTCCAVTPNSLITPSNPALPGELIQVSSTGLGTITDVNGNVLPVDTGSPWYGPAVNTAFNSVTATMNGETAEVVQAGLTEGGYGMYNIQMIVPSDLSANSTTQLYVAQNAFISNTVTLPIGAGAGSSSGAGGSGGGAAVASAQMLVNPTVLVLNAAASSPTQTGSITISNPNGSSLSVGNISVTGPNASDFTFSSNCYGSVSQSCAINITYSPTTSVMENATLVVTENVYGSSVTVPLTGVSGAVYAISNAQSGRVLDVLMASTANGAQIQQYDYLGGPNQLWSFVPVSGGAYVIMNMNSGKVLDDTGASTSNGTLVQQYQYFGNANQQWILNQNGQGFYTIQNVYSGLVLDDVGGGIANGTLVQQYQAIAGSPNQIWALVPTRSYSIQNLQTGKALDVTGLSTTAGTTIQEWDSTGGANQRWRFVPINNTFYTIVNVNSGLVLDLLGGTSANNAPVDQSSYSGSASQQWAFIPTSTPGYYTVVNRLGGLVLDLINGSSQDGTGIQIYDLIGGPNQTWMLVPSAP